MPVKSRVIPRISVTGLATLMLLTACARPISDPARLEAIRQEALSLAQRQPAAGQATIDIPRKHWPPAIAALGPQNVRVDDRRVHILIQQGFDGGYGYEIPRDGHSLAMPAQCYSQPGKSIFWHSPC
jgi:hypothetical protein